MALEKENMTEEMIQNHQDYLQCLTDNFTDHFMEAREHADVHDVKDEDTLNIIVAAIIISMRRITHEKTDFAEMVARIGSQIKMIPRMDS